MDACEICSETIIDLSNHRSFASVTKSSLAADEIQKTQAVNMRNLKFMHLHQLIHMNICKM